MVVFFPLSERRRQKADLSLVNPNILWDIRVRRLVKLNYHIGVANKDEQHTSLSEVFQNGLVNLVEKFHVHESGKSKRRNNVQEILICVCGKEDFTQRNNKRSIGNFLLFEVLVET